MSLTSYRAAPPRAKAKSRAAVAALLESGLDERGFDALRRPGDYLLSQVLRHSTIGAEAFDGRVRNGIGSDRSAEGHQAGETHRRSKSEVFLSTHTTYGRR